MKWSKETNPVPYWKRFLTNLLIAFILTIVFSFLFAGFNGSILQAFIYYFVSWLAIATIMDYYTHR